MKRLVALLLGAAAVPASADVIHYFVHDAVFDDGGEVFGSFYYDTDTDDVTTYAFQTSAGGAFGGHSYFGTSGGNFNRAGGTDGDAQGVYALLLSIAGSWATPGLYEFDLSPALFGDSYEMFPIDPGSGQPSGRRDLVSGYVIADGFEAPPGGTRVPEPAMLGLFGLGAIGLGLARRRRVA